MRRLAASMAFALGTVACTDVLPSGPGDGGGEIDVQVQVGSTPRYSWTGGAAFDVQVIRVNESSFVAWEITDPTAPDIRSPVRHGSPPAGATLLHNNEPTLTPGVLYKVTVTLADGKTSGFREFRP